MSTHGTHGTHSTHSTHSTHLPPLHYPAVHSHSHSHSHPAHAHRSAPARPPLPSPVTSGSVSPIKPDLTPYPCPRQQSSVEHDSEDEASGEERSKLEARREKNRVKQRNLRMRRANHINELESTNTALRGEIATLRNSVTALQQRENNLHAWVRDLESVLFARSLSNEVNQLRRIWASSSPPTAPNNSRADSLATLANAAAASQRPPPAPTPRDPYPTPDSTSWDGPQWEDRKRKRDDDVQTAEHHPPLRTPRSISSLNGDIAAPPHLPPISDYSAPPRPSTAPDSAAPHAYTSRNVVDEKESESRVEASPRSIRISDLLSPVSNDAVGHYNSEGANTSPDSAPNFPIQTPPSPVLPLSSTVTSGKYYQPVPPYFPQRRSSLM